jgi:hypothetical protein
MWPIPLSCAVEVSSCLEECGDVLVEWLTGLILVLEDRHLPILVHSGT